MKFIKAVWFHRFSILNVGWQPYTLRECRVVGESETAYKLKYRMFPFVYIVRWVVKNSESDKVEFTKEWK